VFGLNCRENDPIFNGGESTARSRTISPALYIPGYGIQRLPKLPALLPSNGFSINPPGSKFTFGQLTYMPEPVGYYRKDGDPARYQGKAVSLQRFTYLSPSVAYEVNDEWKVGATIAFSHQALALDMFLRSPNLLIGVLEELQTAFSCETGDDPLMPFLGLCGGNVGPWDDIGGISVSTQQTISTKYHLGALWEPNDWFSWGINYQSEAKMQLKGTYDLRYTDDWCGFWQNFSGSLFGAISGAIFSLPSGVCREAGNLSVDLRSPQHLQTGVKIRVLPIWR
jgi:long-subunit fatty acid transport protein